MPIASTGLKRPNDLLSYFSTKPVERGSIIEVSVRNKIYPALVIKSAAVRTHKLAIKRESYYLKKIKYIHSTPNKLPSIAIKLCEDLSLFYQIPLGQTLKLFIPSAVLKVKNLDLSINTNEETAYKGSMECVLGSLQERIQHYKTTIRHALANEQNICIFVPTINIAKFIHKELSNLPRSPILIHGGLKQSAILHSVYTYKTNTIAGCLIATPIALFALKGGEILIIEDADSSHYQRLEHPILNYKNALNMYSEITHVRCIQGKYFPSLDDLKNSKPLHYISSRIKPQKQFLLAEAPSPIESLIGDQVKNILQRNIRTLLFVSRKGYFTFVMCTTCGATLTCQACGAFLVLSALKDRRYQCNKCLHTYSSDLTCSSCDGWNLKGYGIGTERVLETVRSLFPNRPLWMFDEATLKTARERADLIDLFMRSQDGILVGTDLMLEEPSITADAAIVLSLDNLFSIPDLTVSTRIFTVLCKLKEKILEEPLLIQTKFPDHPIFTHLANQDIKGYLAEELEERKRENLPPYTLAIKLTVEDKNKERREKKIEKLVQRLTNFKDFVSSYPVLGEPSRHIALLTIERSAWQKNLKGVRDLVASCADMASIAVDTESVL